MPRKGERNTGLIRHNMTQEAIVSFLRVALPTAIVTKVTNEDDLNSRGLPPHKIVAARARAVRQGMIPGAHDVLVTGGELPVASWWIEVKTGKATLTSNQQNFAALAERAGCWASVARGIDDVRDFLIEKGVKARAL